MVIVVAFFGIFVGWRFLGKRAGSGLNAAPGLGLSAAVILVAVSVFWFSGYEMIRRATRMAYGGDPFAALQDMVQIALDDAPYLAHGDVIGTLVVGGILVGLIVELVAKRWS